MSTLYEITGGYLRLLEMLEEEESRSEEHTSELQSHLT